MAINYDWYQNPKTTEQQDGEITLHPRIHYNGSTSTAKRHLNRLCKAGILVNRGMRPQPLYYLS